jgi:FixJ family two-component response regulator
MPEKILFVDDEPAILSAFTRLLRHDALKIEYPTLPEFVVETAPGGQTGLAAIRERGPYAVIVSDLRMPGMDGVRFLEESRAVAPASARIMLTGQGDIATAIDGVNRGALFRFLTKPCATETLVAALEAGLNQYLLVTAERQVLDQTLAGSVKVLTEVLSLVNPSASSRALRVRRLVSHVVQRLHLRDAWQLELASLLSQIGYLTLGVEPAPQTGDVESIEARRQHLMHPAAARDLLANIPRLERVAAMVGSQRDPYDPDDAAVPIIKRDPVKVGSQMLRVAIEFDAGMCGGLSPEDALSRLKLRPGQFDPLLVDALSDIAIPQIAYVPRRVTVHDLRSGMVLDQDVRNDSGLLLIARGHEVTLPVLIRLKSLVTTGAIGGQLRVLARAE